jgi:heme/copper-type cytochrome/quinol oxidase subunit 3
MRLPAITTALLLASSGAITYAQQQATAVASMHVWILVTVMQLQTGGYVEEYFETFATAERCEQARETMQSVDTGRNANLWSCIRVTPKT